MSSMCGPSRNSKSSRKRKEAVNGGKDLWDRLVDLNVRCQANFSCVPPHDRT